MSWLLCISTCGHTWLSMVYILSISLQIESYIWFCSCSYVHLYILSKLNKYLISTRGSLHLALYNGMVASTNFLVTEFSIYVNVYQEPMILQWVKVVTAIPLTINSQDKSDEDYIPRPQDEEVGYGTTSAQQDHVDGAQRRGRAPRTSTKWSSDTMVVTKVDIAGMPVNRSKGADWSSKRAGPAGLGRPAWAYFSPVRGLLRLMLLPESSRSSPLLHVGPCHQFLSKLDEVPCLARFSTFLARSSEFCIFSGWVLGFLGGVFTSLLDLYRASRSCHEVLNELIPEVLLLTLKPCINTKL
jgi:hypothetical protein